MMNQRSLTTMLTAVGALLLFAMPSASATPSHPDRADIRLATTFTSTIYSAATHSCVDVPGGTTNINANVVGSTCSNAAEQQFSFQPVAGQAAGTYNVVNAASGLCLAQFRFGIRQSDCLHTTPESTGQMWTLLPVDAAANQYAFEPTDQVGDTPFRVMDATFNSVGQVVLGKPFYVAGTATDTFTLTG
jgi:hypothetical protein